jgi:hypothetical protein
LISKEGDIFYAYYETAVKKAKSLNLTPASYQFNRKSDLAASLGITVDQFFALCEYDSNYLSEVRICYDVTGAPGTEKIVDCKAHEPN